MKISTNLLAQYNYNKNKLILAMPDYYQAFKSKIEGVLKKQDFDFGEPMETEPLPYQVINGIAVIDFCGMTVNKCSELEAYFFGLLSLQDFCEDLKAAVNDELVTQVVINFDSGGGYTMYGEETCELIKNLRTIKPIYAYSSGLMCSMAYKVASCCNALIASPSALVGSINTYCEYTTLNGASELGKDGITVSKFDDFGFTVTTFQGGNQKTIGSEYIALSTEQKAGIIEEINKATLEFKTLVSENRNGVKDEFMQGQAFEARESIEKETNLIDGLENSLSDFIKLLSTKSN